MTTPLPPHSPNHTLTTLSAALTSHLTHYLSLLHTYTTLRSSLNTASATLHQQLARANFASERGRRYGRDDYDERMKAGWRMRIGEAEESERGEEDDREERGGRRGELVFDVVDVEGGDEVEQREEEAKSEKDREGEEENGDDKPRQGPAAPAAKRTNAALRQFGILVPLPLRQAQQTAEDMIRTLVPQLASVETEMREVEIEVRRCRKRIRKVELEEGKKRGDRMDKLGERVVV